jgi:hypothetical protein
MILHQTIGSARAEKRNDPIARQATRHLLTGLLTSALILPSLAAWGMDSPQGEHASAIRSDPIALPPIPQRDPMSWIKLNTTSSPALKIDTLTVPNVTPSGILQSPQDRARTKPTIS